jgi:hypothetical protein
VALTAEIEVSVLALPFVRIPAAPLEFALVYGLLYGGASALVLPLIADPFLAGKTYAITGTYRPFPVASAAVSLLGTGYILVAGRWADRGDGDDGCRPWGSQTPDRGAHGVDEPVDLGLGHRRRDRA